MKDKSVWLWFVAALVVGALICAAVMPVVREQRALNAPRGYVFVQWRVQDNAGAWMDGVLVTCSCADVAKETKDEGYAGFGLNVIDGAQCTTIFHMAGYADEEFSFTTPIVLPDPPGYWVIVMQPATVPTATPTTKATATTTAQATWTTSATPLPSATPTTGWIEATWTASPIPTRGMVRVTWTPGAPVPTATPTRTAMAAPSVTPTGKPTSTPTASATKPTPTRTGTPGPGGRATPIPILYKYFSEGGEDLQAQFGAPIGSMKYVDWSHINPAPGVYNWDYIEEKLNSEAGLTVTLPDGTVLPKPSIIDVYVALSGGYNWPYTFYDATPQWVLQAMLDNGDPVRPVMVGGQLVGHKLEAEGLIAVLPPYDSFFWQKCFFDMVAALGARYDGDPRLTACDIATGLDGETHPVKDWQADWPAVLQEQAGNVPYRFSEWVFATVDAYNAAFPRTPLFLMNAAGGSGMYAATADYVATLSPRVGIKNNSLAPDVEGAQGYGDYVGRYDKYIQYSEIIPLWFESGVVYGQEDSYWTFLHGLSYKPAGIDLLGMFFEGDVRTEDFQFAVAHLGKTVATAPDVWVVLRDWEFPKVTWGEGDGASGRVGDFEYWLKRTSGGETRVWREGIPTAQGSIYSRQCRRTDRASGNTRMTFSIDAAFPGRDVVLTILNYGTGAFSIESNSSKAAFQRGSGLGPVNNWVEVRTRVSGPTFSVTCETDDCYIHKVLVERGETTAPVGKARVH